MMMIIIFFSPFKVNLVCLLEPVVSPIFDSLILSRYSRRRTHIRTFLLLPTAHVIGAAGTSPHTHTHEGKGGRHQKKRRRRRHDNITNRKSLSAPVWAGAVCVYELGCWMTDARHVAPDELCMEGEKKKESTAKEFQMTQQPEQQGGERKENLKKKNQMNLLLLLLLHRI